MNLDSLLVNSRLIISGGVNEKLLEKTLKYDVGAIVLGTYSSEIYSTHPPPWIIRVFDECLLNAYGIRKTYWDSINFMKTIIREAKSKKISVICSFVEKTAEGTTTGVKVYEDLGCDAIEFNPTPLIMSFPNEFAQEEHIVNHTSKILNVIKQNTSLPISIKFPSIVNDVVKAWENWRNEGAKIAHIMNALVPATMINPSTNELIFKTKTGIGGLTGKCIKPISLAKVAQLRKHGETEIIGTGGVVEPKDVKEMMYVGAKGVGVHSVLYLRELKYLEQLIKASRE